MSCILSNAGRESCGRAGKGLGPGTNRRVTPYIKILKLNKSNCLSAFVGQGNLLKLDRDCCHLETVPQASKWGKNSPGVNSVRKIHVLNYSLSGVNENYLNHGVKNCNGTLLAQFAPKLQQVKFSVNIFLHVYVLSFCFSMFLVCSPPAR